MSAPTRSSPPPISPPAPPPRLSEVEYGMILAGHAFQRWMVLCAAAAGRPGFRRPRC